MDCRHINDKLIEQTRRLVLLNRTSITDIAKLAGVSRNTVSRALGLSKSEKRDGLSINVFVAAQELSGGDPVQELQAALADGKGE